MIYQAFKEIEKLYSSHIAVVCEERSYSYLNVDEKIKKLSALFKDKQKSGLIYLKKNEYAIIFQLVLNCTHNVFTSLDIATPKDRVNDIRNQLDSQWIISLEDFSEQGYEVTYIGDKFKVWEKQSSKTYDEKVSHIYFSSGSTGKPKGILLSAEPVVHVVKEQAKIIGMNESKRFAWLLSPSFDASLSDIYVTLLSGGELHICCFSQGKVKTLIQYFKENKITHSDISPSVLPLLDLRNLFLESVIFGGEVANENIIKKCAESINMYNAYGPTENTICSSLKKVDQAWICQNIGNPIKNVEFVVSENNELLISGNNLCIGYMNDTLNQQKFFIKNGVRYYKTGDLVEYKNSEYFYMGRIDRQFKNNGVLISPEEIEQYARDAGCIEAKCHKEKKFTLYYQGNIKEQDLRTLLEKRLNKNMIPSLFVKVDSFKKNINGKTVL